MNDALNGALSLARFVVAQREELGLNATALARESGLSKSEISAIEAGKVKLPGAGKRRALAQALRVTHLALLVAAGELLPEEVGAVRPLSRVEELYERIAARDRPAVLTMLEALAEAEDLRREANQPAPRPVRLLDQG